MCMNLFPCQLIREIDVLEHLPRDGSQSSGKMDSPEDRFPQAHVAPAGVAFSVAAREQVQAPAGRRSSGELLSIK